MSLLRVARQIDGLLLVFPRAGIARSLSCFESMIHPVSLLLLRL